MGATRAQEAWLGEWGDRYTERNAVTEEAVRGRTRLWAQVLASMQGDLPRSALEVGPNLGLSLRALKPLLDIELWGLEPHAGARTRLVDEGVVAPERVLDGFGHDIPAADGAVDLVFSFGTLICINPAMLDATIDEMHRVSAKYLFCAEYFAPSCEPVTWRGEEGMLFRNDYGGLFLDRFPDLELIDYGFWWRRVTNGGDCTWWLFRKRHG